MRSTISGIQIPTAARLNIDGEFTLDSLAGTSGQVLISQGSGNTPAWTSSPTFSTLTADQVLATNNGNGTNFKVGDDVWLGDINIANTMSLKGQQSATSGYIRFGGDTNSFGYDGTKLSYAGSLTTSGLTLTGANSPITLPTGGNGTSGQVLTSAGSGATPTWTTISSFTGGTLTSSLTLRSGTTTAGTAPLYFGTSSPALLTTPVPGAIEYDGIAHYATPENNAGTATSGRALITTPHEIIFSSAPDLSLGTSAVSIIDGGTKGITLLAGMTYEFELHTALRYQSFGDTTTALNIGWNTSTVSGTPTVAWTEYLEYASNTTGFTTAAALNTLRRTSGTFQIATSPGASGSRYIIYKQKGLLKVTGSGSIKFYPTIAPTASTANVPTYQSDSFFKVTPLGNGTVAQIGAWA
jgi:hypothetical protein